MDDSSVVTLEQKIGYTFQDKDIAKGALQLAGNGVTWAGTRDVPNGNKRLAVLGDLVIDMTLCLEWYGRGHVGGKSYPNAVGRDATDQLPQALGRLQEQQSRVTRIWRGLAEKRRWEVC